MLKLVNITKDYVNKGVPTVHALKGISLNFRRSEFVAVLGPSGCGKTTTLNIIGGLDRYTSGDLIIEGKSTKDYKDKDWDTYRNHSIGFIFQSYNLIMHQTIFKNVELALTISGISKSERKERVYKVLEKVGLKGMENKKPNQLSGGQMQRVAIARALINNPEILLADEPTGALDSETSVQIMELLKEVSKDRLVIMVTHNPELAALYATRTVKMLDGEITGDSNPYEGETEAERNKAHENNEYSKGNKKQASMSFITATGLSFSNLLSKIKRTTLVAIAGSIGIIGVSTVLSVSNGVNLFIDSMQDDMLSYYPLEVAEQSVDLASLTEGLSNWEKTGSVVFDKDKEIGLDSMITYLMEKYQDVAQTNTNDITEELIDFIEHIDKKYIYGIKKDYGLDMTNNIFTEWQKDKDSPTAFLSVNGITQKYISTLGTVEGFEDYASYVDFFTNFMKQVPGDKDYLLTQYDLLGNSRFPEAANELLLVVDSEQTETDILLGQLGFYDQKSFMNIALKAIEENKENPDPEKIAEYDYDPKFSFDTILNKKFKYFPHDSIWEYRTETREVATFSYDDPNVGHITFEGVYNPIGDMIQMTATINDTFEFSPLFSRVGDADPADPFYGTWSGKLRDTPIEFGFTSSMEVTLGGYSVATYERSTKQLTANMYHADAALNDSSNAMDMRIVGILKPKPTLRFGSLARGIYYTPALTAKMMADSINSKIITDPVTGFEAHIDKYLTISGKDQDRYRAYVTYDYTSYKDPDNPIEVPEIKGALNSNNGSLISSMLGLGTANNIGRDQQHLRGLCGLAVKPVNNALGVPEEYKYEELPYNIQIFPKDFDCKDKVTNYLDQWNKEVDIKVFEGTPREKILHFEDRTELTYSDPIELIINVINTMITAITIALIVFTSLALVVSCFMIAVITYISTMERVKEIGVIRSLGGRKLDISRLFIAECLIIGAASGVLGVVLTYGISAIINLIVLPFNIGRIAVLAIPTALIMILLSIVLNVLSGLVPSMKASTQDPVVALRTE